LTSSRKPGRPFGLSIAIILSVIYFSILPLLVNLITWRVRSIASSINTTLPVTSDEAGIEPIFSGVDGLPEINFWQILLSLIFLGVAIFAWRGRPSSMRFVLMIAIMGITLFNLATILLQTPPNFATEGIDSSSQLNSSLLWIQLGGNLLIVLYVLWYINRAPSRAFYRGYYLPESVVEKQ
jgi:hypothetical protein